MKKILFILIIIIFGFIAFGYFQKNNGLNGDKWIGIGILILTFVLMPFFLYSRLKNKKNRDRMLNFGLKNDKEKPENQ
jgi:hypothetical protein